MTPAESGCMVIADVSGYTRYLLDTELEHSQDVLADLMETVVAQLRPTLRINRLEGDAAFAYTLQSEVEPSMLLDTIEQTYFAFKARLRDITQATTCECNACRLIPSLDLKFVSHSGRFVRHQVAGSEELTGTDVVIAHRLLKNTVREQLGVNGYSLFTAACVSELGLDPVILGMVEHRESYDDVGEIVAYVQDLDAAWQHAQERRRVFVVPADAQFEFVAEFHATADVVWEFTTSPQKRLLWLTDLTRIDEKNPSGRRGAGTTNHCVHGRGAITEEILDWHPFQYFTQRMDIPMMGSWTQTYEFRPVGPNVTELRVRVQRLEGFQRFLFGLMRRTIFKDLNANVGRLAELLTVEGAEQESTSAMD
ncbi:MAG TPA: DUF2652 domain-containing protein [Acidimicrobiia bacterium]|nr:DUF2652 domain-containing protein [Acidimicrobiia bacterium]